LSKIPDHGASDFCRQRQLTLAATFGLSQADYTGSPIDIVKNQSGNFSNS
jgi:hypothetical protein